MNRLALSLIAGSTLLAASPAFAYIGPGAGLSLLGALWGLVVAVVVTVGFVVLWPLRRMMKRKHPADSTEASPDSASVDADDKAPRS
jgi:membrane protein implicated in regulation of membrane protease activity